MKSREIRGFGVSASNEKLLELKKELIKINAQVAIGANIKDPGQVKKIKKTIAKIYTIQKEKEIKNKKEEVDKKA